MDCGIFFFFFAVGRGIVKSYWVKKKVKKPIVGSEKVEVLEKKKKKVWRKYLGKETFGVYIINVSE